MTKEFKKIVKELLKKGWTISNGRNTYKLRDPLGRLVTFSRSPSCPFAHEHLLQDIKRLEKQGHVGRHGHNTRDQEAS